MSEPTRPGGASPTDVQCLYQLALECSDCRSQADFTRIVRSSGQALLPHASLIAALGRVDLDHLEIVHIAAVDYPTVGVTSLRRLANLRDRPALKHWIECRSPMVLDIGHDAYMMSELERNEIATLKLGRIAAHGVVDLAARSGSYLSFTGVDEGLPRQHVEQQLRLIVPHLHQALVSCYMCEQRAPVAGESLTRTEHEILRWVSAGRTTAEIALMRGRSASTVRNQLTVIFRKLGVRNRAEAVRVELARP
jgi:DNA-binding CsgD family transcriptional regulator